jgi:hypothetical protein
VSLWIPSLQSGCECDQQRASCTLLQTYRRARVCDCSVQNTLLATGDGIAMDTSQAAYHCTRAADGRYAKGQFKYGMPPAKGNGVARDRSRAAEDYNWPLINGTAMGTSIVAAASSKAMSLQWTNRKVQTSYAGSHDDFQICGLEPRVHGCRYRARVREFPTNRDMGAQLFIPYR